MNELYDYLNWRGDLTFHQAPFNKIDSLILSQLSYVEFQGVLSPVMSKEFITLEDASRRYWLLHQEDDFATEVKLVRDTALLLRALANTVRFKNLKLGKYCNIIDMDKQQQFSAMKIILSPGDCYIAYRGTDTTLIGWKEDLNMSYLPQVPSQIEAVNYIEKVTTWTDIKLRVGGHSKGGNLSVFASVNCSNKIKRKIREVYNFDGPGFMNQFLKSPNYLSMVPKIQTYLPETSIIGRLLEHHDEYKVVKSSQTGIQQHDAFSWKISGCEFIYGKDLDSTSRMMETAIKSWIEKLEFKQREQFIQTLFYLFESNHIHSVQDLSSINLKKITEIIKTMSELDVENKKILNETILLLGKEASKAVQGNLKSPGLLKKKRVETTFKG